MFPRQSISDATLLVIVQNIDGKWTRRTFEEFLVELGMYSFDILRNNEEYVNISKRDLILKALQETGAQTVIEALHTRRILNEESRRALTLDGIQLGHSLAGNYANPLEEHSILEIGLRRHNLLQALTHLEQSFQNYTQGNFEAANAMTRSAIEAIVEQIALHIRSIRNNEQIPIRGRHVNPSDYRNYLRTKGFLDNSEKELLDRFYNYASTKGSHPGVSSESEARLRRFITVGLALLFIEKLDDNTFMNGLM